MSDDAESLEVRIEKAWCRLREMHPDTTRTLYLTPRGAIVGFKESQGLPEHSQLLGCFTRTEDLQHFRGEVFFAWDVIMGGNCGAR